MRPDRIWLGWPLSILVISSTLEANDRHEVFHELTATSGLGARGYLAVHYRLNGSFRCKQSFSAEFRMVWFCVDSSRGQGVRKVEGPRL